MRFFTYLIATGLGVGYFPAAPGTAGSILTVLVIYFVSPISTLYLIIVLTVLFLIGIYCSNMVEKEKGEDPSLVVIDEMVGMGVSLLFVPVDWRLFLIAFVLFRIFDIWKPFPIDQSQEMKFGVGVMIDDVIAGIYAVIGVHLIRWLFV